MSDRKREVVSEFSTYYVCDVHGWDFTSVDEDVCPVCLGESLERERIIKLLEDRKLVYKELMGSAESRGAVPTAIHWEEMIVTLNSHIALIKGKSVQEPSVSTIDGQTNFMDKGENK